MKCKVVLVTLGVALTAAAPAVAQDKMTSADGKVFARLSAGAVMPTDTDVQNGVINGLTFTGVVNGAVESEVGQAYSASIGYNFSDMFSIEAEGSIASFDLDKFTGTGTFTSGGSSLTVTGSAALDGDVKANTGMLNALVSIPTGGSFRPYLGAGVGLVDWEIDFNSATDGTTTLVCVAGCSADGTDLAVKGIVGADFAVSDNAFVGIKYQYLWTDTGTAVSDDVTAHAIQASLKFDF